MSDGGKGCERRPQQVSEDELSANWNRIFLTKKVSLEKFKSSFEDKPQDHLNHLLKDEEMGFK